MNAPNPCFRQRTSTRFAARNARTSPRWRKFSLRFAASSPMTRNRLRRSRRPPRPAAGSGPQIVYANRSQSRRFGSCNSSCARRSRPNPSRPSRRRLEAPAPVGDADSQGRLGKPGVGRAPRPMEEIEPEAEAELEAEPFVSPTTDAAVAASFNALSATRRDAERGNGRRTDARNAAPDAQDLARRQSSQPRGASRASGNSARRSRRALEH